MGGGGELEASQSPRSLSLMTQGTGNVRRGLDRLRTLPKLSWGERLPGDAGVALGVARLCPVSQDLRGGGTFEWAQEAIPWPPQGEQRCCRCCKERRGGKCWSKRQRGGVVVS